MRTIREFDVHWWCDSFLEALAKAKSEETGTPWLRL
jgi:trehalose 6-phosphate synthase